MRRFVQAFGGAGVLCCLVLGGQVQAATRSLYAIGNSLTASMLPFSVQDFANQNGDALEVGFHTRSGAALDLLLTDPAAADIFHPVTLDHAFAGYTWTDMSVQPYPSATSTLDSDIAAVHKALRSATSGVGAAPRLFIYCAWPSQASIATAGGFAAYWHSITTDSFSQPTVLKRDYFDHLVARLAASPGAPRAAVIPVGDVLASLDELIRAGQFAGVSDISQLYVDNDHLGDVGKFIAGATVYATVFGRTPSGLSIPAGYVQGGGTVALTPELAARLEALVWQVVNSDARTGVNSMPVANAQEVATAASTPLPITLAASDAEGTSLTYRIVIAPAHGQIAGQAPAVIYTPDAGFSGIDTFSFRASDGGLESHATTVTIRVTAAAFTPNMPNGPTSGATGGGGELALWSLAGVAVLACRTVFRKITATPDA